MKKTIALIAACFCMCMPVFAAEGKTSTNIHKNNCSRYGYTVTSNLYENAGALERVEYIGEKVIIEKYGYDGTFKSAVKEITPPLPIFGCFYSGEKYNYLVFGAYNTAEDNTAEVIRLQRYSKNWELQKECSVYGSNTYAPFSAGSARITEADGKLYLYTCHTMYKASDGYNHQSNMQIIVDIASFESPSNPYYPYTSHSFNQFIRTDGSNMYTVDHGDAYPRAIVMSKYPAGTPTYSSVSRSSILAIAGTSGDNETGVSIGGFELGANNALIAGNTVVQNASSFNANAYRNIFLGIAPKDMGTPSVKMLTSYTQSDSVTLNTPFLLKTGDNEFLAIWEEIRSGIYTTKIVKADESGNIISDAAIKAPLSMCEPVLASDGLLHWYTTDTTSPIFYWLDPKTYDAQKTVEEDWSYNEKTDTLTIGGKGFMPGGTLPWAQYNEKVKTVVIKDGVYSISESAFSGCTALESISIADTVSRIGASAFKGCTALKSITLPKKVTKIETSAFEECSSLKTVTVLGGITQIGSRAFYNCAALESINIPDTMTDLGTYAFFGCAALTAVNIPDGTPSIPMYCFNGCAALKKISLPDSITSIGFCSFEKCAALESVDMPKTLSSIGGGAFENCTSLKSIVVPTGVKTIQGDTFRGDTALEKAVLPETLTSIGTSSFYECKALAEVNIPDSVQNINSYAFSFCNMKTVNIPEGITALNTMVFAYCPLEEVHIPSSVKTIGTWAFGASRLKTVTVPEGVTSIGKLAFYGSSMRALILPHSVTDFHDEAFDYFSYYEYVYCYKGSQAESFAKEKNVNYKYIGDIDGDSEITVRDTALILKYADKDITYSTTDYNTAALLDCDLDGKCTEADAAKLLHELIEEY